MKYYVGWSSFAAVTFGPSGPHLRINLKGPLPPANPLMLLLVLDSLFLGFPFTEILPHVG